MAGQDVRSRTVPAVIGPALAAVFLVAYVVWFYAQRTALGGLILSMLLLPDEASGRIVKEWMGGSWERFGVIDRVPVVLVAAGIVGVALALGRLAIHLLKLERWLTRAELLTLSLGVGLNLVSLITLAVGLAGGLRDRWIFVALGGAFIAAWAWRLHGPGAARQACQEGDRPLSATEASWLRLSRRLLWFSLPFVVILLFRSMVPPWYFDVRGYHLQVPKEWYLEGRIGFLPHNVYGNMPLGAEMFAVLGMSLCRDWWIGALVGKLLIGVFPLMTAALLLSAGWRLGDRAAGAMAALMYLSTPWIIRVTNAGLIDGVSAFYAFGAVYCVCFLNRSASAHKVPVSGEQPRVPGAVILLAGYLAGAAVACKYPALLFLVVPLFLGVTVLSLHRDVASGVTRRIPTSALAAGLLFVLAVFAGCGLWLAKNAVLTGNPTYPLLYNVFGGRDWTPEQDVQWSRAHRAPADGWTFGALRHSLRLTGGASEHHSPLLVPFALLAVSRLRARTWMVPLLLLMAFNFASWWLLTHRVDRFLLPVLPLLCLLAGFGVTAWSGVAWRRCCGALIAGFMVILLVQWSTRTVGDNRFLMSLKAFRLDLPNRADPNYFHTNPIHYVVGQLVVPGHKALLVGEAQAFDFEVPVIYNTCFNPCVFEQRMAGRTQDERLSILRQERISYVLISWQELARYREPGGYGYSDYVTPELIQREFVDTGILREVAGLPQGQDCQVFEVIGWETWSAPRGMTHMNRE
ncbi:MAG: hypothetical protein FJ276_21815 [Planctomycetes bacterium]|nr:hypothetical protein [Planctomycetota bacterium]